MPRRFLPPRRPGLSFLAMLFSGGLAAGVFGPGARAQPDTPGAKGAQIYCYMRGSGNSHAVSWQAAYALIKRQSASLFKTSPTHAAVMITEAVVQNPSSFPDCGRYLGDLYNARVSGLTRDQPSGEGAAAMAVPPGSQAGRGGLTRGDRYGY